MHDPKCPICGGKGYIPDPDKLYSPFPCLAGLSQPQQIRLIEAREAYRHAWVRS